VWYPSRIRKDSKVSFSCVLSQLDDYDTARFSNGKFPTVKMPAITSTSVRMHGEFLRLLFLQAHRETENSFSFMGTPAQPDQDQFRFRRPAFYSVWTSTVGLIAAKAAALRINMNTDSCLVASRTASRRLSSSHATSLLNSSLSHHLPRPQPFPHPN
jgi:hypothetical protein